MARYDSAGFLSGRNELVLISAFMIVMMIFIAAAEAPLDTPDWFKERWPEGQSTPSDGDGNKTMVTTEIESRDGYSQEGSTSDVDIEVVQEGAVSIKIELTWTDDIGNNDELGLSISNSTDVMGSDSGTSGSLVLSFASEVEGDLIGAYTVSVEAIDCPGLVGPIPVDRDNGNSWTLTVTLIVEEPG